jgi:hypothetical protein
MARLVGDQLEQDQLQLAGVEDPATSAAAAFAVLATAEAVTATAMTVAAARFGVARLPEITSGPSSKAAPMVAFVGVVVSRVMGKSHAWCSFMFRHI